MSQIELDNAMRKCGLTPQLVHERLKHGKRETHVRKYGEHPCDWLIRYLTKFAHEWRSTMCLYGRMSDPDLDRARREAVSRGYPVGVSSIGDGNGPRYYVYLGAPVDGQD